MGLNYFDADHTDPRYHATDNYPGAPQLYDGNVRAWQWRTQRPVNEAVPPGMDRLFPAGKFFNKTEAYRYQYDKQDRILGATYGYYDASSFYSETNGAMQERNLSYDPNGNIQTLSRTGYQKPGMTGNVIDSLRYSYKPNTNQLVRVEDRAPALLRISVGLEHPQDL